MTTNLFPRSDWGHLVLALPAAGVQLVLLASLRERAPVRRSALAVASLALVAALAASGAAIGTWIHREAGPASWGPRVPLRPVSAVYRIGSVPRVIRYLRARLEPGEPIFVARAEPLLYWAADATNPTRFPGVLTVLHEEQEREILAALPRVRYVVMSDTDQPLWTYYSDELPRVWEHLERHYRVAPYYVVDQASWLVVLERTGDRGPTLVDLFDEREKARFFVRETPDGPPRPHEGPLPRLAARQLNRPLPLPLGAWGGGVDFDLAVPEGARFEAGIGYRGMVSLDDLHEHPRRSRMIVSVGRDGVFEPLLERRADDSLRAGQRWTPVEADLSSFAGQRVTLRLELVPDAPLGRNRLAWWGSPRLAGPPAAGELPVGRAAPAQ